MLPSHNWVVVATLRTWTDTNCIAGAQALIASSSVSHRRCGFTSGIALAWRVWFNRLCHSRTLPTDNDVESGVYRAARGTLAIGSLCNQKKASL